MRPLITVHTAHAHSHTHTSNGANHFYLSSTLRLAQLFIALISRKREYYLRFHRRSILNWLNARPNMKKVRNLVKRTVNERTLTHATQTLCENID